MQVTLCMIVKNEARTVEQALLSVIDTIDNAIIVDTGSTDNTREIIQNFFYRHKKELLLKECPWEDDFSKARNEGIKEVKDGNYIIILDADQKLALAKEPLKSFYDYPECLYPVKRNLFEKYIKESGGTFYYCANYNVTEYEYWERNYFYYNSLDLTKIKNFPYYNPGIFIKSSGLKYFMPVHEIPLRLDENYKDRLITKDTLFSIVHIGYAKTHKKQNEYSDSSERNLKLIKKSIKESKEIQKNLSDEIQNRIKIRTLENKRILANYHLNTNELKEALIILKEIIEEFELLKKEGLLNSGKSFFIERIFVLSVMSALELEITDTTYRLDLCKKVISHFENKGVFLSFFYAVSSELKLVNFEKYPDTEILKEILLSLVPENPSKVMNFPKKYLEDWLNSKEKLLQCDSNEINYYIPPPEVFYKFMSLLGLAEYFYLLNNYEEAFRIISISKKVYLFAWFDHPKNILFNRGHVHIKSFTVWLKRYITLLSKLIKNLNGYSNFMINEVEYFKRFYDEQLKKYIDEGKEPDEYEKFLRLNTEEILS